MKPILLLCFVVFFCIGCGSSHTDSQADAETAAVAFVAPVSSPESSFDEENLMESVSIDIDRAGIISVGMPVNEVYQWFDSTRVRKAAGRPHYTIVSADASPLISFTVSAADTITSITIQNPTYQTEKSIGVGSTYAQLRQAYHIASISATKDGHIVATVEELQKKQLRNGQETHVTVQFELGVDATALTQENTTILPGSVPPDTRITRINL